jgi:hypothetical protein
MRDVHRHAESIAGEEHADVERHVVGNLEEHVFRRGDALRVGTWTNASPVAIGVFADDAPTAVAAPPNRVDADAVSFAESPGTPRVEDDSRDFVTAVERLFAVPSITVHLTSANAGCAYPYEEFVVVRRRVGIVAHAHLFVAENLHSKHGHPFFDGCSDSA